jgi:hypothetical protein
VALRADTIYLRNGESVEGTFQGGTTRQIRVDVNGEIRTFDIGRVQSVTFSDPGYQSDNTPRQQPAPPPVYRENPRQESRRDNANDSSPGIQGGLVIPADTSITIRMIESVDSQTARLGQTFRASIDEPVFVNGQEAIPRGADVWTKLVEQKDSGKFEGRAVLTLALDSITVNGRPIDVTSTDVRTESGSRGERTAKVVGGTAVLGAIIGGIAGGGKGAAIGAGSGAAIGGGAQVLTNGQQVKIPSETRLTFRLQAPAQL